ncbi:hypothetical protein NQ317_004604 [Molorchus minor]|uniref:Uncharacterized protein n=1 Tax=Molorchus minor TaxID=1323400 RepID=A0ABQ9IV33_9CUCU|nr:hypothetical protein NQ317_004604 [Molorchus minor]
MLRKKSYPVAEDSGFGSAFFTTSTEQNNISRWKNEKEKDVFPRCLMFNTEYRNDIWRYLRESESQHPTLKSTYMLKQPDLNWNTRSILIDWLSSVAVEYKFCNETFHLGVNYIDRFLSQIAVSSRHSNMYANKFQLVGASAMMVAGKIEEYQAIDAQEWSYLTGDTFSAHKILKMEQLIMKMLKFRMQPPTIYTFIRHLSSEMQMEPKIVHLAMYISELALLEGDDYLNQFPSKLAAASIALARYTFSKQKPWPEKLKGSQRPVVQRQQKTFRDSPSKGQQAIQTKYKSEKYNRVALLKPRALNLNDFDDDEE